MRRMKTVGFYKNNRSNNLLHIETENCIVNIRLNDVGTSIEVLPDKYAGEERFVFTNVDGVVKKSNSAYLMVKENLEDKIHKKVVDDFEGGSLLRKQIAKKSGISEAKVDEILEKEYT